MQHPGSILTQTTFWRKNMKHIISTSVQSGDHETVELVRLMVKDMKDQYDMNNEPVRMFSCGLDSKYVGLSCDNFDLIDGIVAELNSYGIDVVR